MNFDNYVSEDAPPRLMVHSSVGGGGDVSHVTVGPSGEILIYPGSILHIDCLFSRKKGNPQWTWTRRVKDYPTGNNISERDQIHSYNRYSFRVVGGR